MLGLALLLAGWGLFRCGGQVALRVIYIAVLLLVAYSDVTARRIPNRISYPAILFAAGAALASPSWQNSFLGGIAGAILLSIPVAVYGPERAGIGDVKLAFLIGLIHGFSLRLLLVILTASGAATAVGLVGLILRRLHRRDLLPFGCFLSLAAVVALLAFP